MVTEIEPDGEGTAAEKKKDRRKGMKKVI